MKFSLNNFLYAVKNIVTGGGSDEPNDSGFLKRAEGLQLPALQPLIFTSLTDSTTGTVSNTVDDTTASVKDDIATLASKINEILTYLQKTADETNARVLKVEETVDSIGHIIFPIPRDYDEATDVLKVRVLASMVSVSTDTDVELDAQVYKKTAGSALGADLNPTAPGTILSATEQWIEFDLSGNSFTRDDVMYFKLITNGGNDTDGEEVLIHDFEVVYRSTLVSYDEEDSSGNALR